MKLPDELSVECHDAQVMMQGCPKAFAIVASPPLGALPGLPNGSTSKATTRGLSTPHCLWGNFATASPPNQHEQIEVTANMQAL